VQHKSKSKIFLYNVRKHIYKNQYNTIPYSRQYVILKFLIFVLFSLCPLNETIFFHILFIPCHRNLKTLVQLLLFYFYIISKFKIIQKTVDMPFIKCYILYKITKVLKHTRQYHNLQNKRSVSL